jgi:hypothetical protein
MYVFYSAIANAYVGTVPTHASLSATSSIVGMALYIIGIAGNFWHHKVTLRFLKFACVFNDYNGHDDCFDSTRFLRT